MAMSNISVKKETHVTPKPAAVPDWDPARLMRQFFGWDPFREMSPMFRSEPAAFSPAFEVKETKEGYLFKADLPGVKEGDLEITMTGNRLSVSGKRDAEKEERADTYYTYERAYGSFTRSFTLPNDVDANNIKADLRDGVMTLFVPRKPETMPKKIAIGR